MKNVEIEYKVMVSKNDYEYLKEKLSNRQSVFYVQENHYYDTDDLSLKAKKVSLRIRHIINKNQYLLTLKETLKEGRLEHEFYVKDNSISSFPLEIIEIINKYNVNLNKIKEISKLKTERREYKDNNYTLCLDYNQFYNKEDYEIECEADSMINAKQYIDVLLNKYQIKYSQSKESKIARAMKNRF